MVYARRGVPLTSECRFCHRSFTTDRLPVHMEICKSIKPRTPFDSTKKRLQGIITNKKMNISHAHHSSHGGSSSVSHVVSHVGSQSGSHSQSGQVTHSDKPDWRDQREEFRRQAQQDRNNRSLDHVDHLTNNLNVYADRNDRRSDDVTFETKIIVADRRALNAALDIKPKSTQPVTQRFHIGSPELPTARLPIESVYGQHNTRSIRNTDPSSYEPQKDRLAHLPRIPNEAYTGSHTGFAQKYKLDKTGVDGWTSDVVILMPKRPAPKFEYEPITTVVRSSDVPAVHVNEVEAASLEVLTVPHIPETVVTERPLHPEVQDSQCVTPALSESAHDELIDDALDKVPNDVAAVPKLDVTSPISLTKSVHFEELMPSIEQLPERLTKQRSVYELHSAAVPVKEMIYPADVPPLPRKSRLTQETSNVVLEGEIAATKRQMQLTVKHAIHAKIEAVPSAQQPPTRDRHSASEPAPVNSEPRTLNFMDSLDGDSFADLRIESIEQSELRGSPDSLNHLTGSPNDKEQPSAWVVDFSPEKQSKPPARLARPRPQPKHQERSPALRELFGDDTVRSSTDQRSRLAHAKRLLKEEVNISENEAPSVDEERPKTQSIVSPATIPTFPVLADFQKKLQQQLQHWQTAQTHLRRPTTPNMAVLPRMGSPVISSPSSWQPQQVNSLNASHILDTSGYLNQSKQPTPRNEVPAYQWRYQQYIQQQPSLRRPS